MLRLSAFGLFLPSMLLILSCSDSQQDTQVREEQKPITFLTVVMLSLTYKP